MRSENERGVTRQQAIPRDGKSKDVEETKKGEEKDGRGQEKDSGGKIVDSQTRLCGPGKKSWGGDWVETHRPRWKVRYFVCSVGGW